ncbi:MAG: DpnI domain-containing protein [Candidatus Omnitrophota bacterium]
MRVSFENKISENYKSFSQKIRVLTEEWVYNEIFCPACGCGIEHYANNKPVADFFCLNCTEDYELKSKKDSIGSKIVDGTYRTMLERLRSNNNPNLFLLNYSPQESKVLNFFVIPKHFFIPQIIEKRKPLSESAKRAGWVGCNISLQNIPRTGKIFYVKDKQIEPKEKVLKKWRKTLFLREQKEVLTKGWILDIMNCIDRINKQKFKLNEVYAFRKCLAGKYPNNKHIEDKIRQQLQFLRDKGYLRFATRGTYELI